MVILVGLEPTIHRLRVECYADLASGLYLAEGRGVEPLRPFNSSLFKSGPVASYRVGLPYLVTNNKYLVEAEVVETSSSACKAEVIAVILRSHIWCPL